MWDWQYLQQVWLLYVTGVIPSFPRKYKQLAKLKVIPLRLGTPCQGLFIELGQRKKTGKNRSWKLEEPKLFVKYCFKFGK